jgi:Domain of unknown function (DUF4440)
MPDQMDADVLAADDRRFEAMRKQDGAALDASLADDLVYVHSTARVESKAEHTGNLRAGRPYYRGIAPRDRQVRVRGDVGIVNGVPEMHVENAGALEAGMKRTLRRRRTWRLIDRGATPAGAGADPPASVRTR